MLLNGVLLMNLENTSNNNQIGFYARILGIGLLTTLTTVPSVSSSLENLDPNMPENAYVRPESDINLVQERLDLLNASNSENHKTFFVDSMISKFDTLYQYEDPPVDDIQYTEYFIKDFASYINHDIHYIDMLDMVDIKINEDDYISIKLERDGRSLYFEIKDKCVYFTKLWFQDGRLISSDGTLTKEIYKETWEWIINGNL